MKLLKNLLISLFILLILAVATLWFLAKNTNSETIKSIINNQVNAATNKKSVIDGTVSWQLFPAPGIKITQMSLGEKDVDPYYISVNKILLSVKIAPMFTGKLVFSDLTLDGATIDINTAPVRKPLPVKKINLKQDHEKSGIQFDIERFLLAHGQMNIHTAEGAVHLKNLKVGIEQFNLRNIPFSLQLKAQIDSNFSDKTMKAQMNYNGHMSLPDDGFIKQFPLTAWPFVKGQLQLKNTQFNTLFIDNVNANITTNAEKVNFSPLTLTLYGGESVGDMYYSRISQKLYINQTATNLDGKSLMTALINHERIQGNLDYSIQAEVPLNKLDIANLTGKGNLTLKDGKLNKVNLVELIEDMNTMLSSVLKNEISAIKKALDAQTFDSNKYAKNNTSFNFISIQYLLDKAELVSESLILQTDDLQIKGEGSLNLLDQRIQSRLQVTVSSTENKGSLQNVQKILGGSFPVILQGTLENPSIEPDIGILNYLLNNLTLNKPLIQKLHEQLASLTNHPDVPATQEDL